MARGAAARSNGDRHGGAPLHHLYLAFGDDRPYAWFLAAAAGANIVANLALIPLFGLVGAGMATLLANALLAGILWRAVNSRLATLETPAAA